MRYVLENKIRDIFVVWMLGIPSVVDKVQSHTQRINLFRTLAGAPLPLTAIVLCWVTWVRHSDTPACNHQKRNNENHLTSSDLILGCFVAKALI